MVYIVLFIVAFLSGSLLPLGSEGLLIYDIKEGYSLVLLLSVATFGNVLGAVFNYYLGLRGEEFLLEKGFVKKKSLYSAKERFKKIGSVALLLSSLPIIGDPLTFIAGILGFSFKKFLILVTISKALRYIAIAILIYF